MLLITMSHIGWKFKKYTTSVYKTVQHLHAESKRNNSDCIFIDQVNIPSDNTINKALNDQHSQDPGKAEVVIR